MSYYITKANDLATQIRARQEKQDELEKRIDTWVYSEWGIENFTGLMSDFVPDRGNGPCGVLCRQLATIRVEEISFHMTCKHLGLDPMNITYVEDVFNTRNKDKVHLIKLPWITGHSKNGNPIVKYEKITQFPTAGRVLSSISIDGNGTNLPKYHHQLRMATFDDCPSEEADISMAFKTFLRSARNKPFYVYENVDGHEVRTLTRDSSLINARPPAEWYYPLYLLSFMTGKMVLFETYENPEGEVGKIREHFQHTMDIIKEGVGVYPLVVEIPPLKLPMMYINQAVISNDWKSRILAPPQNGGNIINMFNNYASQVIALKKNN
ncbi:MAG: hypothetical protein PHW52_03985 [Candidatus Pacebacteria bacterium]|nr:hypothetical protein [Candidatus Paceibacterota bacterium]